MHASKAPIRERIKQLQEQQGKVELALPGKFEVAPPAPDNPPPEEPASAPAATYACGHMVKVKQSLAQNCPECAAQKRRKKSQNKQTKFVQRQAQVNQCRLPNGSAFASDYDGEKMVWSGRLTVPNDGGVKVFEESAGAVLTLMFRLDKQYRTFEAARTKTA
jgi:hypothetical protein